MPINNYSLDIERDNTQYAKITDASQTGLNITGDLTIEAWVRLESLPSLFQQMAIASKYEPAAGQVGYRMYLVGLSGIKLAFISSDDGTSSTTVFSEDLGLSINTWYHLAVTYHASAGTARLFLDGVFVHEGTGLNTSIYDTPQDFAIGSNSTGGSSSSMDGEIDEVRVWNTSRTDAEIAAYYDEVISGNTSGLQGYWRFENDYTDQTPNQNDLTGVNTPTFNGQAPTLTFPKSGLPSFLSN